MADTRNQWVLPVVAGLSGGLFMLDLFMPLGVAIGVLYAGVVLLASFSSNPRLPLLIAGCATGLLITGAVLGPRLSSIPLWVGVLNCSLGLMIVWVSAVLLRQRHQMEIHLRQTRDALEDRVAARTKELADVNRTLVNEISEHIETERSLRTSEHALATSRQELQDLTARLLTVQEEERRRISRDLHDDINQRLAMLVVQVESLDTSLPAYATTCSKELRSIQDRLTELSDDVRHLAYQFHPSILDDLGLTVALQRLVDDCATRWNLQGRFNAYPAPRPLPQKVSTCLYRIAQECLANVAKHARATRVMVCLSSTAETVTLNVEDNGVGFDTQSAIDGHRGLGLVSMTERVRLVQGTVTIDSTPQKGTRLHISVPYAEVPV
ncbi:MAG: sensor histidine kinase [Nitrospirota bacterium]|nr:sensor histidine kinase [Nitrospirota bacterium]